MLRKMCNYILKAEDSLNLWKRWFEGNGNPWVDSMRGEKTSCFFCGEDRPSHKSDCVYTEAEKLLQEAE